MSSAESTKKISEIMMLPLAAKSLNVAAELGIADLLSDNEVHIEELSSLSNTDKDILLNLLKVIEIFGFFSIDSNLFIKNNGYSELLKADHPQSMRHFCMLFGHEYYNAYDGLLHTTQTKCSGFKQVYQKTLYDYLDSTPERALAYDLAMRDFSRPVGAQIAKTFETLFSNSKNMIDIGGGSGVITIEVLRQFPHLSGCIFDKADVCDRDRQHLPKDVKNKITLHTGDFFKDIPSGYDVYVLKNVLHNWNDQSCKEILKTLSTSLGDSRLIVVEPIIINPAARII